jgi:putative oligomerization/nucleic acid binding protein
MKVTRLLALYPHSWRLRYGEEIAAMLGEERLSVSVVVDLILGAIDAHLHPELAGPVLAAAGGGTLAAPPGRPRRWLLVLMATLVVVFLLYGGLYAYRAQPQAMPAAPLSKALSDVQGGRVTSVLIEGTRATVTLADGTMQRVTLPDRDQTLSEAVNTHNSVDPAHPTVLRFDNSADAFEPGALARMLVVVLGVVLPILALVTLLLVTASIISRGSRRRRYESLARVADLRDRGVLTEDEFQREKRKLLE